MITKGTIRIKEVKDIFRISGYDISAEATYTLAKLLNWCLCSILIMHNLQNKNERQKIIRPIFHLSSICDGLKIS